LGVIYHTKNVSSGSETIVTNGNDFTVQCYNLVHFEISQANP